MPDLLVNCVTSVMCGRGLWHTNISATEFMTELERILFEYLVPGISLFTAFCIVQFSNDTNKEALSLSHGTMFWHLTKLTIKAFLMLSLNFALLYFIRLRVRMGLLDPGSCADLCRGGKDLIPSRWHPMKGQKSMSSRVQPYSPGPYHLGGERGISGHTSSLPKVACEAVFSNRVRSRWLHSQGGHPMHPLFWWTRWVPPDTVYLLWTQKRPPCPKQLAFLRAVCSFEVNAHRKSSLPLLSLFG